MGFSTIPPEEFGYSYDEEAITDFPTTTSKQATLNDDGSCVMPASGSHLRDKTKVNANQAFQEDTQDLRTDRPQPGKLSEKNTRYSGRSSRGHRCIEGIYCSFRHGHHLDHKNTTQDVFFTLNEFAEDGHPSICRPG